MALPASAALDQAACDRASAAGVLSAKAPVGCDRLAVVDFSYVDFSGAVRHDGQVMVLAAVAPEVAELFERLRRRGFPVAGARLMEHYRGDDAASMEDNNTSAFNDRKVTGGGPPSLHAYGLAIDINPVQNPYVGADRHGTLRVSPAAGAAYLNRMARRPGKPARAGLAEDVVQLFAEAGFTVWGGHWDAPLDYQHFQFPRSLAERLAALPEGQARTLFRQRLLAFRACRRQHPGDAGTACAL